MTNGNEVEAGAPENIDEGVLEEAVTVFVDDIVQHVAGGPCLAKSCDQARMLHSADPSDYVLGLREAINSRLNYLSYNKRIGKEGAEERYGRVKEAADIIRSRLRKLLSTYRRHPQTPVPLSKSELELVKKFLLTAFVLQNKTSRFRHNRTAGERKISVKDKDLLNGGLNEDQEREVLQEDFIRYCARNRLLQRDAKILMQTYLDMDSGQARGAAKEVKRRIELERAKRAEERAVKRASVEEKKGEKTEKARGSNKKKKSVSERKGLMKETMSKVADEVRRCLSEYIFEGEDLEDLKAARMLSVLNIDDNSDTVIKDWFDFTDPNKVGRVLHAKIRDPEQKKKTRLAMMHARYNLLMSLPLPDASEVPVWDANRRSMIVGNDDYDNFDKINFGYFSILPRRVAAKFTIKNGSSRRVNERYMGRYVSGKSSELRKNFVAQRNRIAQSFLQLFCSLGDREIYISLSRWVKEGGTGVSEEIERIAALVSAELPELPEPVEEEPDFSPDDTTVSDEVADTRTPEQKTKEWLMNG